MGKLVVAVTTALLVLGSLAVAQDGESVRINVKEDLIEISASQDTWHLGHGIASVRVDRTSGMSPQEVEDLLLAHLRFDLTVDGVGVEADRFEVGSWVNPPTGLEVWIAAWQYDIDFAPGIHVLTGKWITTDLPCALFFLGCDTTTWPTGHTDCDFVDLQPCTIVDGLVSEVTAHTLTLIVLP